MTASNSCANGINSTVLTLLSTLSPSRPPANGLPSAVSTISPQPDPRRHSPVCCCSLCEQCGTGEQAMRSVRGDYQRFLASLDRR